MTNPEEKAEAFLESAIKNFKIFIDTCSLMSEQADKFWTHAVPVLQREGKSVIVPFRVYEEVKKFADNPALCAQKGDESLNRRAKNTLNSLGLLQKAGIIAIFGDKQDNFADNVFQTVFTQFRLKYNLMLITQDSALAQDIAAIGKSKSVHTKNQILVERINRFGYLSPFQFKEQTDSATVPGNAPRHASRARISDDERFAFASSVRNVAGKMPLSLLPSEGDQVIAERGGERKPVKLLKAGPSGGEGTIYATDIPGIVAKIYKPERLDRAKFEKLGLMLTKSIDCEGVCFPLALVYNQKNEFAGYLMKEARGRELQRCVFIPQLLKKTFPDWTKQDTVTLCITILRKLKYLHERNIVLGDINPNNILVVSPEEVYFVDTDSYQIEGFPCPVGTINYTPPEIQRREYSSFLRTLGNERFAVATLLFMIMLPGKPPYSLQGGENQIDNIMNGDFAYASGTRSSGKAPQGMWRFCWSHLPRFLKDDFYETFRKGGEHSAEDTRYSTGDWLKKFENYLYLLKSNKLIEQDAMSLEIFPSRLKKNPKMAYINCKICGNEVIEEWTEQGICQSCLKKGETFHCAKCGRDMIYSNYQKYIKHSQKYEICKDCFNKRNMVYATLRCSVCGNNFEITNGTKEYCDANNYPLPKKCRNCRGLKAGPRTSRDNSPSFADFFSGIKKGCFITTAACGHMGLADDCHELVMLRYFRDTWLVAQPRGHEIIEEYYRIAPLIVERLDASPKRQLVYPYLWQRYILPCVRMIEQNSYEACCSHYEKMILSLKRMLQD